MELMTCSFMNGNMSDTNNLSIILKPLRKRNTVPTATSQRLPMLHEHTAQSLTLNSHLNGTLQQQPVSWEWGSTTAVAVTWGMDSAYTCWLLQASARVTSELLYTCWLHPCQPPLSSPPFPSTLPCWLRQTCNVESLRTDICVKTILFACMHIYSMCIENHSCPKGKGRIHWCLSGVEGGREQWPSDWLGRKTTVQVWPLGSTLKPHSATTIAAHTKVQQLEPCLRPSV